MHYLKLITAVSTNSFLHKYSFYISIIHLLCPEFTGLIAKKRLEVKNLGSQLSVRLLLLWRRWWWWWGFTHTAAAVVAPAFSFNITPLDSLSQMNVLIFQLSVSLHTEIHYCLSLIIFLTAFQRNPIKWLVCFLYCFYWRQFLWGSLSANLKALSFEQ